MLGVLFQKEAKNRQTLLCEKNEILESFKNMISPKGGSVMLRKLIKVNQELIRIDDSRRVQRDQLRKLHTVSAMLQRRIR